MSLASFLSGPSTLAIEDEDTLTELRLDPEERYGNPWEDRDEDRWEWEEYQRDMEAAYRQ